MNSIQSKARIARKITLRGRTMPNQIISTMPQKKRYRLSKTIRTNPAAKRVFNCLICGELNTVTPQLQYFNERMVGSIHCHACFFSIYLKLTTGTRPIDIFHRWMDIVDGLKSYTQH